MQAGAPESALPNPDRCAEAPENDAPAGHTGEPLARRVMTKRRLRSAVRPPTGNDKVFLRVCIFAAVLIVAFTIKSMMSGPGANMTYWKSVELIGDRIRQHHISDLDQCLKEAKSLPIADVTDQDVLDFHACLLALLDLRLNTKGSLEDMEKLDALSKKLELLIGRLSNRYGNFREYKT